MISYMPNSVTGGLSGSLVPIGGYADVMGAGSYYKAPGAALKRALYPEMSAAFPAAGTYSAALQQMPVNAAWMAMAYGNGTYVSVGSGNSANAINAATSLDGSLWIQQTVPASIRVLSMAFGAGIFVAVGDDAGAQVRSYYTTKDGVVWVERQLPVMGAWNTVVYSEPLGLFVAFSGTTTYGPSTVILTSPDGVNWTQRAMPSGIYFAATAFPGGFVAIATRYGTSAAFAIVSVDGITWNKYDIPDGYWTSVAYGNGTLVVNGYTGANPAQVLAATSSDGKVWVEQKFNTGNLGALCKNAFGNGVFVAVYGSATIGVVFISADGVKWDRRPAAHILAPGQIVYNAGKFVYAAGGTTGMNASNIFAEGSANGEYLYVGGTTGKYVRVK